MCSFHQFWDIVHSFVYKCIEFYTSSLYLICDSFLYSYFDLHCHNIHKQITSKINLLIIPFSYEIPMYHVNRNFYLVEIRPSC